MARRLNLSMPVAGQMDAYLIPHLEAWIEDDNQPGSLSSLRSMLDDEEDEAKEKDEDEDEK